MMILMRPKMIILFPTWTGGPQSGEVDFGPGKSDNEEEGNRDDEAFALSFP